MRCGNDNQHIFGQFFIDDAVFDAFGSPAEWGGVLIVGAFGILFRCCCAGGRGPGWLLVIIVLGALLAFGCASSECG